MFVKMPMFIGLSIGAQAVGCAERSRQRAEMPPALEEAKVAVRRARGDIGPFVAQPAFRLERAEIELLEGEDAGLVGSHRSNCDS